MLYFLIIIIIKNYIINDLYYLFNIKIINKNIKNEKKKRK